MYTRFTHTQTQNSKYNLRHKHKTQNTKHKTQTTKLKTQNTLVSFKKLLHKVQNTTKEAAHNYTNLGVSSEKSVVKSRRWSSGRWGFSNQWNVQRHITPLHVKMEETKVNSTFDCELHPLFCFVWDDKGVCLHTTHDMIVCCMLYVVPCFLTNVLLSQANQGRSNSKQHDFLLSNSGAASILMSWRSNILFCVLIVFF